MSEVYTTPIYVRTPNNSQGFAVPGKQAVIDSETDNVLGVVSTGYRLVTNREACAYARKCAAAAFPNTKEDEWEILVADAPRSKCYCHIDLYHKTGKLDFDYVMVGTREDVPDVYGPYVRVTNSYNGQRALKFTIGCYRKTCQNGLTAASDLVSFSFAHTKDSIKSDIKFKVAHYKIQRMRDDFKEYFDVLHKYQINREDGTRLIKAVLAIRMPKSVREENGTKLTAVYQDWFKLDGYIDSLYTRYANTLGDTAYAVLQASTDLASQPINNLCLRKDRHALQRLAGEWLVDFRKRCVQPDFDLSAYLSLDKHSHEGSPPANHFSIRA